MTTSYNLIRVTTKDEITLSGLYNPGEKSNPAVIFIHGFFGDFYTHDFYHAINNKLKDRNSAYILAQTRGTGLHTEFIKTDGSQKFIGSYYERIEEAHIDISAFVKFLMDEGYTNIVLAGHSLGTIKVTRYLFEGEYKDKIKKLILLAPFDKNAFMQKKAGDKWDEYLKNAEEKIKTGKGQDIVPIPEYEDYPTTYETFVSWYNRSELSCLWDFYRKDYKGEILKKIQIPVLVMLGEADDCVLYPEFDEDPKIVMKRFNEIVPNWKTVLVKATGHTFNGHEASVADEISKFI